MTEITSLFKKKIEKNIELEYLSLLSMSPWIDGEGGGGGGGERERESLYLGTFKAFFSYLVCLILFEN